MEPFALPATERTPAILLDPVEGVMEIRGRSIPENADRFFTPLHAIVDAYAMAPRPTSLLRVELSYFNSSTAKFLLDLFRQWEDLHASGRSKVRMEWLHARNDADMAEAGEDYRSLLEFPVKVMAVGQ
ncbi:MAG: DUF1987 domain-containing protein [Flavobacteriales bacterium]